MIFFNHKYLYIHFITKWKKLLEKRTSEFFLYLFFPFFFRKRKIKLQFHRFASDNIPKRKRIITLLVAVVLIRYYPFELRYILLNNSCKRWKKNEARNLKKSLRNDKKIPFFLFYRNRNLKYINYVNDIHLTWDSIVNVINNFSVFFLYFHIFVDKIMNDSHWLWTILLEFDIFIQIFFESITKTMKRKRILWCEWIKENRAPISIE